MNYALAEPCCLYYNIFIRVNKALINKIGDWSNGMIGVSKTFGGSSILSSPASGKAESRVFFPGFQLFLHKKYRARFDKDRFHHATYFLPGFHFMPNFRNASS